MSVMGPIAATEQLLPPPGLSGAVLGGGEATSGEAELEASVTSPPGLNAPQHLETETETDTETSAAQFNDKDQAYVGAALCQGLGGMTATTAMPIGSWKQWFPPGFDEAQWCKWDEGEPAVVRLGGGLELPEPAYVAPGEPGAGAELEACPQLAWPYWPEAAYHAGFDAHPSFGPAAFPHPWYAAAVARGAWRWERQGERAAAPTRARTDSDLPPRAGAEVAAAGGRGRTQSADGLVAGGAGGGEAEAGAEPGRRTTVMLRNLPNNYTRAMLLALLDEEGFAGQYDFVYLPMDFKTHASLGYAFVNLSSPERAAEFWKIFEGFGKWVVASQKVCSVSWSCPYQGLTAHIERYRNSPVMHEDVPDDYKPMVFQDGGRSAFPVPTKKLKAPRMRLCRDDGVQSVARQAEEE